MFRVALTGGIGSGKTVVSDRLLQLGAAVIDSDVIARRITAPGGLAMAEIARTFGNAYLTADGALDRARMRKHVFEDPRARARLEAITHPLIRQETAREAASAAAMAAPYQVFAIPLLVESGYTKAETAPPEASQRPQQPQQPRRFDRVLTIDCTPETQLTRLMQRSGLDALQARAIIEAQASREARIAIADDVLINEHKTLPTLMLEIDALHHRYCQAAQNA